MSTSVEHPHVDIAPFFERFRQEQIKLDWKGPFSQYFDLVCKNPRVAQLSHSRIYDMISQRGFTTLKDGSKRPNFFDDEIFGLDKSLVQLGSYFNSAAKRLEVRKRILLLMGPVGGGKSTLVSMLKKGLEDYSKTDQGAAYALDGCPMNEEPLHLIPDGMRPEIEKDYGVYIEGDLCPCCRTKLKDAYQGRAEDFLVNRFIFSEKNRKGIGTFTPSDPKSQDISEMTGSIDLATIGDYGVESDSRAFRFDGELNVANRGIMEFIEMLKCDERFLYNLLTLSQEQNIKTGRFAMMYADEAVISHTNEYEFNAFVANKKSEALHDRLILIKVPYNLRLSDEIKIYEKLMAQAKMSNVHFAPNSLKIAATFAILSRLEDSKKLGMTKMKKLRLYNGEEDAAFKHEDVEGLQAESVREGMDGISPRFIINCLSQAASKEGVNCLNEINTLRAIRDGLEQRPSLAFEDREKYLNLITETRKAYDEEAKKEVQKAFVYSFEESAATLLNEYLDNIEAYSTKTKLKNPITNEDTEPDEKLMRSIEAQINISENGKKVFREEVLIRLSSLARKGERFEYTSHDRLKEAIEKKLFADLEDIVKITTSTKTPDAEQLKRADDVAGRLIEKSDYCKSCAKDLLSYVGTLLNR